MVHAKEYVVSTFALVILLFFCSPIIALAIGMTADIAPSWIGLKLFVGLTNIDVVNSLHSLLLPLVSAVVVFRSDYFVGIFGTLVLVILCASILTGFFVFMATNPAIFGSEPRFNPYINEYKDVHQSIFQMISMLIVLFLAKLGLSANETAAKDDDAVENLGKDQQQAKADDAPPLPSVAANAMPTGTPLASGAAL